MVAKVIRNLAFYFGLYFLSTEMDKSVKIPSFDKVDIIPTVIGINSFFAIQIILNHLKRKEIEAKLA